MSTALRIAPAPPPIGAVEPGGLADHIRQLQTEAKLLARDHIALLGASLSQTQRLAEEIAGGGEAYPAGVRDIARRLADDSAAKALTLQALMARIG
jgi:hypothetical protein